MKIILVAFVLAIVSQATILITQPAKTPFQNNTLPYYYSNFGQIHYGKPALYSLVLLDTNFCDSNQTAKLNHFIEPTYVVINGDLGYCSYPSRALIAQNLGAAGIIFGSKQIKYAMDNVVISDDGHGRKVKINALFISPESLQSLKNLKDMKIKVNFPIIKKQVSSVMLFLNAAERSSYIFLRNFRPYFEKIKSSMDLNIVYHTIECLNCLQEQCILQKKCCTFDTQNLVMGMGKYIVEEQFRQNNIFKYAKKANNMGIWFDYMNRFDQYCDNNWVNSKDCSQGIQKELKIEQNMEISDKYSEMMEWRLKETKTGVFSYPDFSVNGIKHFETLSPKNAFTMVCESLINEPQECSDQVQKPNTSKTGLIVCLVILGILLIIMGICCYRKLVKKQITNDMSSRVSELVAKYAAKVSDHKKKKKEKLMERITEEL